MQSYTSYIRHMRRHKHLHKTANVIPVLAHNPRLAFPVETPTSCKRIRPWGIAERPSLAVDVLKRCVGVMLLVCSGF